MKKKEQLEKQINRFKKIREDLGMNRTEFSQYMGIPLRTLEEWEAGRRMIPEQQTLYVIGLGTEEHLSFCLLGRKCIIQILKCSNLNTLKNKPYAEEADLLNVALFGFTAKAWRESNPELAKSSNVRDYATINELTVLSNLETHNAQMIREGKLKEERFQILK